MPLSPGDHQELVASKDAYVLRGRGQDEIIFYNDKEIIVPVDDGAPPRHGKCSRPTATGAS